jgi:uncharacterized protein YccT (UPF0319 family)
MNHSFSMSFHKISFGLIIISILSACQATGPYQAYEGPKKTAGEVATFVVPTNYNLLSINGSNYQKKFLEEGATINLLPGSHQLIIEYHDIWDLTGQDHEKVTSKPISITFITQAGTQYSINNTLLETVEQSRAFAEKPSIKIVDTTNKQDVSAKIKYNLYGRSLFALLFGDSRQGFAQASSTPSDTVPSATQIAKPTTISTVPVIMPAVTSSTTATKEPVATPIAKPKATAKPDTPARAGQALEMLKYWWETADEKQQDDFSQWLKNH